MRLSVIEALCEPSAAHNEDAWGRSGQAVWVLDGATGIGDRPHLAGPTDAAWFADRINTELVEALAAAGDLGAALNRAVEAVREAATALCDLDSLPNFELPCASFTLVRAVGETALEFANLGDCRLAWRMGQGPVATFGTSGVTELDARMERLVAENLARGLTLEEVGAAAKALAREHRKLINIPEGYWILDISGAGVPHLQLEVLQAGEPMDILLMSDGFSRLVDVFGRYDYDSLLAAVLNHGLAPLYAELRASEAGDPECRTFARNKTRDDATAVLLRFA